MPARVSVTSRVVRANSLMPSSSSSFRMRWLIAVCDRFRWAAAFWKLPRSAMLRKACNPRKSMRMGVSPVGLHNYELDSLIRQKIPFVGLCARRPTAR